MEKLTRKIFRDQKEDEEIIFSIKKHPWYFSWLLFFTLLALVIILMSFKYFGASAITSYEIYIAIVGLGIYFGYAYFRWSRTQYILTNHRVISFEQEKMFKKVMKEARLENILFISNKVEGAINSMLERGSVHIRASGVTEDEIVFDNIAEPYEVQKQIAEAQKKYVGSVAQQETEEEVDEIENDLKQKTRKGFDIYKK